MADEAGICNSGLSKIGSRRIVSLTQGGKSANFCAEQYPKLRDRELRRHTWNFSKTIVKLAQSTTAPVAGFEFAYQQPNDWLRTISVHGNEDLTGGIRYAIVGQTIHAGVSDVWLVYVKQIINPNEMTSDFREALAALIAQEGAIPLASSRSLRADMKLEYQGLIRGAKSIDAIEDFPEQFPEPSWSSARNGTRFSSWSG